MKYSKEYDKSEEPETRYKTLTGTRIFIAAILLSTIALTACTSDNYLVIGSGSGSGNRQYEIKTEDPQTHESNNLTGGTSDHIQINLLS